MSTRRRDLRGWCVVATRAAALALVLAGCTRVVDSPRPVAAPTVAPITAGQVSDLLSEKAAPDDDPNLFVTVEPEECAGLGVEVDPPFLYDPVRPAAYDGGQWFTSEDDPSWSVVEMVAVYRAEYDAGAAIDRARRAIESCRGVMMTATAMDGDTVEFELLPQEDSGAPEIVLWSVGGEWSCDDALIAAYNATVEITACGDVNGFDIRAHAHETLKRIHALANTTA